MPTGRLSLVMALPTAGAFYVDGDQTVAAVVRHLSEPACTLTSPADGPRNLRVRNFSKLKTIDGTARLRMHQKEQ